MKNLKSLTRKQLKAITGAAKSAKCQSGEHWCPDAGVCLPIVVECYIIIPPDIPEGGCLSC